MSVEEYDIDLPTLHPGQVRAYDVVEEHRFVVGRCGRRFGKTDLAKTIVGDSVAKGGLIGWFAPDYDTSREAAVELDALLEPIRAKGSRIGKVFRAKTKGRIDFWTLDNERAGRSRKYNGIVIDEAAFTNPKTMMDIWNKSIKPTLLDYGGWALVLSNTNGVDPENFLWRLCNQKEHGFFEFHAPTHDNPYLDKDEVAKLKKENHPLVYKQEYLAEFVDWSGVAFFSMDKMLIDDAPVPYPTKCDLVFAIIDSAIKTGTDHDGTAVTYFAYIRAGAAYKLVILDWDLVQIEGALLETWLPVVLQNCEVLARKCGARAGSGGAFIEDKASGMILLQQALRKNMPARAIDSKLTSVGKDERAISVSGYVYRGMVKFSDVAFNKTTVYKGTSANHQITQVVGFRVGDKDAARRADDLLDTFCYGIAIALGNAGGF